MSVSNYEEVDVYPLDPDVQEQLLQEQNECAFCWGTRDHWPVGVMMTYVWLDGSFWLTATSQRKRIAAIKRDPRVTVIISGKGTSVGEARTVTAKGRVTIHDDPATKDRIYPLISAAILPGAEAMQGVFTKMLDSSRRLVLEVKPEQYITYDARKMMVATDWTGGGEI
jgi:nitroimidazol reductase NimA-like FMN-containing flavoprotein (pyridoxamine 5'-phosphate oxidase superfamily)